MPKLNLNLLAVLVALDDARSVTQAALKLGMSQPALSAALGKLRSYFDDQLYLRVGNRMEPTPRAATVVRTARSVLARIDTEILAAPVFEAALSEQPVRLALSDVGEMVFLPSIMRKLRELMPRAAIDSVSLPAAELPAQLESGSLDLAIGYFPDLHKLSFFQQTLFKDSFACLIRADHPIASAKLSIRQFLRLEHAVVRVESRTEEVIERYLARHRLQRRVALTSPHFASVPLIVAQSDLLVTVPEPLARYYASAGVGLRFVELPFNPPRIELRQFWHQRFHHEPRSRWLRSMIFALFRAERERRGKT